MREQTEESKAIKRFAYTGPSSKKHSEGSGNGNTSGYGISRPNFTKKSGQSAFGVEDTWNASSSLFDMALPTSPRTSTTGFYSRYSNYKGGNNGSDLPRNKSPSSSQELSRNSGASWNQPRAGYSYSHHDPKMTSATMGSKTPNGPHTRSGMGMSETEDASSNGGRYSSHSPSKDIRASASSSWNDL